MAPNDYGPRIQVTAFTLTAVSTVIVSLRYVFLRGTAAISQGLIVNSDYTAMSTC